MMERIIFSEEIKEGQHLRLVASGEVTDAMLETLEDFIRHQRMRIVASGPSDQIPVSTS